MHFKTVLAHLKSKIFSVGQLWWPTFFHTETCWIQIFVLGPPLQKNELAPTDSLSSSNETPAIGAKKTPQLHEVTLNPTIYKSNSSKNTPAVNVNETPIILIICVQKLSLQNHLFCTKVTWWKKDQMIKMTSFWSKTYLIK